MGKLREEAEEAIKKYGKEAFLSHRDEVCDAIESICFCLECLQNQEDWGGKRAIPLRATYFTQEEWEKSFSEQYDHDIRRVELGRLRMELNEDDDIPLKNFLFQGLDLMINGLWYDPESWMQLMETQIMTDQYTDYRAFLEAVYVLGLLEVWNLQMGISFHFFRGDFRDAEYFLGSFASQVLEEEREYYKDFCVRISEAIKEQRRDDMKEILKERARRLKNMQEEKGGIPVLDRFDKSMGGMSDEDFERFVTEQIKNVTEQLEKTEDEDIPGLDYEMKLQRRKNIRIRDLAELFVYGGSRLKERLFHHLSEEDQMLAMEWWMADYYPSEIDKLVRRLDGMLHVVWPETVWDEDAEEGACESMEILQDKRKAEIRSSVEKVMGRATQERNYRWV